MAILKIARMGHPVLLTRAKHVADPTAAEIAVLIQNMAETLEDAGGVGLAAPQVHESLRLFIYKVPGERVGADEEEIGLSAVINPVLTPLSPEVSMGWEGCLSIPGLRAAVPRYERIHLAGFDATGAPIDKEISGFHARVVQHEADHLDGILYPMRMSDFRYFGFQEETVKYDFPLPKISLQQEQADE
ncbi:MAG: peptide deformylase [Acidocella sp.]|nr:peptide deformylase [Acidocella sp.]